MLPLVTQGFPGSSVVKNLSASVGASRDVGSIPGLGRSPRGENGNPPHNSGLENPMGRGVWQAWGCKELDTTEWLSVCACTHTHTHTHTHTTNAKQYHLINIKFTIFSSVQSLGRVWLFATPWTAARQASLSITNYQSPPKPLSIESVMPSKHLILEYIIIQIQYYIWVKEIYI